MVNIIITVITFTNYDYCGELLDKFPKLVQYFFPKFVIELKPLQSVVIPPGKTFLNEKSFLLSLLQIDVGEYKMENEITFFNLFIKNQWSTIKTNDMFYNAFLSYCHCLLKNKVKQIEEFYQKLLFSVRNSSQLILEL